MSKHVPLLALSKKLIIQKGYGCMQVHAGFESDQALTEACPFSQIRGGNCYAHSRRFPVTGLRVRQSKVNGFGVMQVKMPTNLKFRRR